MSKEVTYKIGDIGIIDDVRELWGELNLVHIEKSLHFEEHYKSLSFQDRKHLLLKRAREGEVFVIIACDGEEKIGHCVASVDEDLGVIESLFVRKEYRKENIGGALIEQALAWLKSKNPRFINLRVAIGNEEVFSFYSKYGFMPRATELQIKM